MPTSSTRFTVNVGTDAAPVKYRFTLHVQMMKTAKLRERGFEFKDYVKVSRIEVKDATRRLVVVCTACKVADEQYTSGKGREYKRLKVVDLLKDEGYAVLHPRDEFDPQTGGKCAIASFLAKVDFAADQRRKVWEAWVKLCQPPTIKSANVVGKSVEA